MSSSSRVCRGGRWSRGGGCRRHCELWGMIWRAQGHWATGPVREGATRARGGLEDIGIDKSCLLLLVRIDGMLLSLYVPGILNAWNAMDPLTKQLLSDPSSTVFGDRQSASSPCHSPLLPHRQRGGRPRQELWARQSSTRERALLCLTRAAV